jgi:hypothetical protein
MPADGPTETSPLLPESPTAFLEPGDAPEGPLASINGNYKVIPGEEDEERQDAQCERAVQYEGLPEVKKQLKYILPAIAIGVGLNWRCVARARADRVTRAD